MGENIMRKFLTLTLTCALLFTSLSFSNVYAEDTSEKLKENKAKQEELDKQIETLNEKISCWDTRGDGDSRAEVCTVARGASAV